MSWQYYKNGKLKAECSDITPETLEDAIRELRENGVDVSDCTVDNGAYVDDFWSPDYPPEEAEYQDTLTFAPLTIQDIERFEKEYKILEREGKALKASKDFSTKLYNRIQKETGVNMKPTRLERFFNWCKQWTDEEVSYLIFWVITIYVMIGVIKYEPKMIEIILWPFM
jgi:hypothetical protein